MLERRQIPDSYRTADVEPGASAVVWRERFTKDDPGFIDKIGIDWYAGTLYEFHVDGVLVEKFERTLEITEPDEYNPPFLSVKEVKWLFRNNSNVVITAGVLCSGYRVRSV